MSASVNTCTTQAMVRTLGLGIGAEDSRQQIAGRGFHKAHELWMKGRGPDEAIAAFHELYDSYSDRNIAIDDAYDKRNLANILGVYFRRNPLTAQSWETVQAEEQLEIWCPTDPSNEFGFLFTDIHDGITKDKTSGLLWSRELKTTSSWNLQEYVREYFLKGQILSHVWTARKAGIPVVGVQLSVIRINKLPELGRLTKAGKPYQCKTHHCACEDCWQAHVEFGVWDFQPSEYQLNTWERDSSDTGWKYFNNIYNFLMQENGTIDPNADLTDLPKQGILNGSCGRCDLSPFCQSPSMDKLTRRNRDPKIRASGLEVIKDDAGRVE